MPPVPASAPQSVLSLVKRYSIGGVASEAVVAVILICVALSLAGTEAKVIGLGVGGSVSALIVIGPDE